MFRSRSKVLSFVLVLSFLLVGVIGIIPYAKADDDVTIETIKYGKSGAGRDLTCVKIGPANSTHSILCVFEIHGFEDCYYKDGQRLVNLANGVIDDFTDNPEDLQSTTLYIVASANPDGLAEGTTNNGPGRCQVYASPQVELGVDINRDFDWNYQAITPRASFPRNYTPYTFSCPESRALRDLVQLIQPDDVIDFHGWFAGQYGMGFTRGTQSLAECFDDPCGLSYVPAGLDEPSGQFYGWAGTQADRSALVELRDPWTISHNDIKDGILIIIDQL